MAGHHAHSHHHHDARHLSEGRLRLSIVLNLSFVLLEAAVGLASNSLALLSDAGHNFTDVLALALSWYALWIARKPATATKTFGYHRVNILVALANAVTLVLIALLILHEAWDRFRHPQPVATLPMIVMATAALLVNAITALWLRGEAQHSLNMRSAFLHMVGDAMASAGVIATGLLIYFTGWNLADPVASVLIALFIAYSSWAILLETVNILLEGAPRGVDSAQVARHIREISGVSDVHDLHVWAISDGMNALSCHLLLHNEDAPRAAQIVREVKAMLADRHHIGHSTIETECGGCDTNELHCRLGAAHAACAAPDHDASAPRS
jgi:cobalt-zinc-cadmium efflux system protein